MELKEKVMLWVKGYVLDLDRGGSYTLYAVVKDHQIIYLKSVIFVACEF